jgi:hypothetical protein
MLEACVSQQEQQVLITNNKQIHNILKCSVTSIWPTSDIIKLREQWWFNMLLTNLLLLYCYPHKNFFVSSDSSVSKVIYWLWAWTADVKFLAGT